MLTAHERRMTQLQAHHRVVIIAQRTGQALLALLLIAAAAPVWANQLTAIDAASAGGGQVTIRLTMAENAPVPSVFTVNNPARLSIDLPDTTLAVNKRFQHVGQGAVEAVNTAAAGDTTRVVIELSKMVAYTVHRHGHEMLIKIGNQSSQLAADAQPPSVSAAHGRPDRSHRSAPVARPVSTAAQPTSAPAANGSATAIRNIDFRRSDKGAGQLKITLNGNNAVVDVSQSNGQIIARLPGVRLPRSLQKRLDVTDFATPVDTIDAMAHGGNTRIVITPAKSAEYEQLAYQTGNNFFIELQPLTAAEQAKRQQNNPKYTGKKISLSFQGIDVRKVLQIIADVANVNMVVSDSVSGTMALRLEHVPWDQALDIILNAKGLGMQRQNNVITVAPLPEIAAREQAQLVARKATSDLAPLHSEIMQINYAQAASMAALLKSDSPTSAPSGGPVPAGGAPGGSINTGGGDNSTSLLSDRGHVTVDSRTNSLLVTDTRENLDRIRRIIHRLDIPVRQVLIQSRIVIANRDFTRNLGVSQTGVGKSSLTNAINNGFNGSNNGYSVSLPATGATSLLSGSIITDTFSLNLELSAMETENRGEIISSPRVITADGQEATIEQGREIPYQQGSQGSNAGTSVSFKKAVLSLDATPKITPDNKVQMSLKVTQDSVGAYVPTSNGGSVPSIDTRSLTTNILVNDGDTVVLGGVFEQTNNDQSSGVPFIKDIPLVGRLFSGIQRSKNKRELLIFVTPRILRDTLTANR
ncbi:MAG: type IV pilus secretin PilQ [Salinisphaera sp.]|nr:type IV pilus secretin PilQ [Salinisphaera sp.]